MWATYIGIFKPGARENPDTYYDRPFGLRRITTSMFTGYRLHGQRS